MIINSHSVLVHIKWEIKRKIEKILNQINHGDTVKLAVKSQLYKVNLTVLAMQLKYVAYISNEPVSVLFHHFSLVRVRISATAIPGCN